MPLTIWQIWQATILVTRGSSKSIGGAGAPMRSGRIDACGASPSKHADTNVVFVWRLGRLTVVQTPPRVLLTAQVGAEDSKFARGA